MYGSSLGLGMEEAWVFVARWVFVSSWQIRVALSKNINYGNFHLTEKSLPISRNIKRHLRSFWFDFFLLFAVVGYPDVVKQFWKKPPAIKHEAWKNGKFSRGVKRGRSTTPNFVSETIPRGGISLIRDFCAPTLFNEHRNFSTRPKNALLPPSLLTLLGS